MTMKQRTRLMNGEDLSSYNMGNSKKDDGDVPELPLHRMKPQEHYIEAQVQEGDTLQAIALRFYCTISELKRINHIHKDNEIFARRTIKVPITPYSVLTERVPMQPNETPSTSNENSTILQEVLHNNSNYNGIQQTVKTEDQDCAIDCNSVVLNSNLAPAILPYKDIEPCEQVSEDTKLLPNKDKISVEAVVVKELTSHGADFGLKWFHLVFVLVVLCVVIPLWYVLFDLDKPDQEHPNIPPLHKT